MIVVRDVFRLKYGQARPALATFKEAEALMARLGATSPTRVLTDLVGPAYTMVLESSYPSVAAWEEEGRKVLGNEQFRTWYQKFTPFVESGYREIFTLVS